MSSGPAFSVTENNIEIHSSPSALFQKSTVENGDSAKNFKLDGSDALHQNNATHLMEEQCKKLMEKNHVLQPKMIENVKQNFMEKSQMSVKTAPISNYRIENSSTTMVGASGDGFSPGSNKIICNNKDGSCAALSECNNVLEVNSDHPKGDACRENLKYQNPNIKIESGTYANATQNSVSPILQENTEIVAAGNEQGSEIVSLKTEIQNEDVNTQYVDENNIVATNGDTVIEEQPLDGDTDSPITECHQETEKISKSQSRMKLLVRSKAICHDDISENLDPEFPLDSPLSSSSTFISDSIFPSPFPISREEALKETLGLTLSPKNEEKPFASKNGDEVIYHGENFENDSETVITEGAECNGIKSDYSVSDADTNSVASKPTNTTPRREMEKPPRMMKQRSQDRLLLKQQKSFDAETKRENLSRESSVECVDSTGVDVHEFLITTLRSSQRDRVILLKLEHDMIGFVNDKTIDFMKFPPMTSYHRMLVHRVAAYFGMDHNVDETGKSVIINKTSSTRLPDSRFTEHFDPRQMEQMPGRRDDDMRRRSILKRTNQSRSFDRDDIKGRSLWKDNRQRSIEEREEEYEKIRARIFSQEGSMQSPSMYGRRGMSSMAAARMASWTDRPWNSTGSSSSVSSMGGGNTIQNYPQNRQTHNLGNPRPPTPVRRVGDGSNGTLYYHMQPQNPDLNLDTIGIEDDMPESWFEMSESPETISSLVGTIVVPNNIPILLAVPMGMTLPSETVLCHPVTGMPYLSPEGYQLVYQTGPSGTDGSGVSSPHIAQYYQMPPQPSPQHPGMVYTQGQSYNPYQEPQKGSNSSVVQGSSNTAYTGMVPQSPSTFSSSYQQNISMTTTAYAGMQAQQNMSYTYQPSTAPMVYRPDQMMAGQTNGTSTSQANLHMHPVMYNPAVQGKQHSPAVYGNQNLPPGTQQQNVGGATFQPYVYNPRTNPAGPPTQPPASPAQHVSTVPKDGPVPNQMPGSGPGSTPRTLLSHPQTMMQPQSVSQQYAGYQQRPVQVIYSPPTAGAGGYSQNTENDVTKSSNPTNQDISSTADDQLSEKMQAIVLKNIQQQQGQSLDKGPDSSATVTTSVSPSTNPTRTASQQSVPDGPNQMRMSTVAMAPMQHITEQHPHQQYTNTGGMQQPQTMQVHYFMPANSPVPTGPSYRTYSQFMTQPQTPHVMGPGMHFVYLSPPFGGVMGMDGQPAAVTPTPQILHNLPQQFVPQGPLTAPNLATNTNNNNIQLLVDANQAQGKHAQGIVVGKNVITGSDKEPTKQSDKLQNSIDSEKDSNQVNPSTEQGERVKVQRSASGSIESTPNSADTHQHGYPATSYAHANTNNSKSHSMVTYSTIPSGTGQAVKGMTPVDPVYHHPGQHVMPHPGQQILLGANVPRDYRVAGMNVNSPPSFATGMVPQYPVYPGMNSSPSGSPYVKYYLPATASHGQKLTDVKMYPTPGVAAPPSNLIAVQLPNQNQIQLVPASMPPPTPIYYAPHNHMTNEYSAVPVTAPAAYTLESTRTTVTTSDVNASEGQSSTDAEMNKTPLSPSQGDGNATDYLSENNGAVQQSDNQTDNM